MRMNRLLSLIAITTLLTSNLAWSVGKIQNEDVKSVTDLTNAGGSMSQLINDTKIYVTANNLNQQLSTAISGGNLGGSGGGGTGVPLKIANSTFESNTTSSYTADTPAHFVTSSTSPLDGTYSAIFTPTATSEKVVTAAVSVPAVLQGQSCQAQMYYSTTEATSNYVFSVTDGSGNVLASESLLPVSGVPAALTPPLSFLCPSTGTPQVIVKFAAPSTGVPSASLKVDDFSAGGTIFVAGPQAQNLGVLTWNTGLHSWTNSANSSYSSFGVSSTIPSPTASVGAVVKAPGTNLPEVVVPSAAPGCYRVTFNGGAGTSSGNTYAYFTFNDGTNNGVDNAVSIYSGSAIQNPMATFSSDFCYSTAQTNLTFQAEGRAAAGSTANIYLGTSEGSTETVSISVLYFPFPSQTATPINQMSQPQVTTYLSGSGTYITPPGATRLEILMVGGGGGGSGAGNGGTGGTGGTGGNTTFGTSFLSAPGATGGGNPNPGCGSAGSIGTGATGITIPGGCGTASSEIANAAGGPGAASAFGGAGGGGLVSTAGSAASTNSGSGGGGAGSTGTSISGAGGGSGAYVNASVPFPLSSYAYSVGIAGTSGAAGTSGTIGGAGGSGLIKVTAYFGAASLVIPNSVISGNAGTTRHEYLSFAGSSSQGSPCTSSPCTIYQPSSSWVSSVTRGSTGFYTVHFVAGMFSSPPLCQGSGYNGLYHVVNLATTSGIDIEQTTIGSSSAIDDTVFFTCDGPK
jgi:hypothetical protein